MRQLFSDYLKYVEQTENCLLEYKEGTCQAVLNVAGLDIQLGLAEESGMLLLLTGVGLLPDTGREKFYEELLSLNNRFSGTMGLTLGVDRNLEIVTLQGVREFSYLSREQFLDLLGNFASVSAQMIERIASGDADNGAAEDRSDSSDDASGQGNVFAPNMLSV